MKKRLLSLFLTFSMMLTFFPVGTVTVFASGSPMAYTDGLYQFILNADNTATITQDHDPCSGSTRYANISCNKNRRPGVLQLQLRPNERPDSRHCNRNWRQCFL